MGGKFQSLILLDLSSAFNTAENNMLLHRLEDWVGFSGTVLYWFKAYLKDRDYFVLISNHKHEHTKASPRLQSCASSVQHLHTPSTSDYEKQQNRMEKKRTIIMQTTH